MRCPTTTEAAPRLKCESLFYSIASEHRIPFEGDAVCRARHPVLIFVGASGRATVRRVAHNGLWRIDLGRAIDWCATRAEACHVALAFVTSGALPAHLAMCDRTSRACS